MNVFGFDGAYFAGAAALCSRLIDSVLQTIVQVPYFFVFVECAFGKFFHFCGEFPPGLYLRGRRRGRRLGQLGRRRRRGLAAKRFNHLRVYLGVSLLEFL